MIVLPSSQRTVVTVREVAGTKIDQIIVGSCANSSYQDLMAVAKILEGKHIHSNIDFHVNPASRQILENVMKGGGIFSLIKAGARINIPGCMGCFGFGQTAGTDNVSLRTFPRNIPFLSEIEKNSVYLCSPETAAVSALKGEITDPRYIRKHIKYTRPKDPKHFIIDDSFIVPPKTLKERQRIQVIQDPHTKPLYQSGPLEETVKAEVVIKVGDHMSADIIMPERIRYSLNPSNIETVSEFVFCQIDPEFPQRCKAIGDCVVVAGENYGHGLIQENEIVALRYL